MLNKKNLIWVFLLTIISLIIGVSYAYFTPIIIGNDTASSNTAYFGSLKLNYDGSDAITLENAVPGASQTKPFTVTNSGTLPVSSYDIYFSELVNTILYDEAVYEISCLSSDANPCSGKIETPLPNVSSFVMTSSTIAPGTTHTYSLKVTFKEMGYDQNYNQDANFSFKITINKLFFGSGFLRATTGVTDDYAFWGIRDQITDVVFNFGGTTPTNNYSNSNIKPSYLSPNIFDYNDLIVPLAGRPPDIPAREYAINSWDVSADGDGSVIAYIFDDGLGNNTYLLVIEITSGSLYANPDSSHFFEGFSILKGIYSNILNVQYINNASAMYKDCPLLTIIPLSILEGLDNLNDASYMFYGCSSLNSISMSNYYDLSLPNIEGMFGGCVSLTIINLTSIIASNITNYNNFLSGVPSGLTIRVRSADDIQFFENRLIDAGITGTVIEYPVG